MTYYLNPDEKTLLLDMNRKNLKNKEKVTAIKCIGLEKSPSVFNKEEYKFM